jgi:methylmalonyl-CoA mutase cobalamin-binding subunit
MPGSLLVARVGPREQRGDHRDRAQQIRHRTERRHRRSIATLAGGQIGPPRRQQRPAAVGQHQQQLNLAAASTSTQHLQRPAL